VLDILLAVEDARAADRMQRQLDPKRERILVVHHNGSVHGFRAKTVICRTPDRGWFEANKPRAERFAGWVEHLRTRVVPGGDFILL
jgi:hypothetical protein